MPSLGLEIADFVILTCLFVVSSNPAKIACCFLQQNKTNKKKYTVDSIGWLKETDLGAVNSQSKSSRTN